MLAVASCHCLLGVTGRKPHLEQIWSALPQTADINSSREEFSVVPNADIESALVSLCRATDKTLNRGSTTPCKR
jgi:hypothetical protein